MSRRKIPGVKLKPGPQPAALPHADMAIAAKMAGKTTKEIAEDIGTHRETLARWLNSPEQLARMARIREALQAESLASLAELWEANLQRLRRQMAACATAAEGAELQRQMEQLLVGIGVPAAGSQPASSGGDQVSFTLREAVMNLRRHAQEAVPPAPTAETIEAYAETETDN